MTTGRANGGGHKCARNGFEIVLALVVCRKVLSSVSILAWVSHDPTALEQSACLHGAAKYTIIGMTPWRQIAPTWQAPMIV